MCKEEIKAGKVFDEKIFALAESPAFMNNVVEMCHPTLGAHLGTCIAIAHYPLFWYITAQVTRGLLRTVGKWLNK
jgi:hypothetical protein